MSKFRAYSQEWSYVGIQITGAGNMDKPKLNANVRIENVSFYGYSASDECGDQT